MSERTIRRSVWQSVAAMVGIAGVIASIRNSNAYQGISDENKKHRFRNNFIQKADAKIKKVRRWRKRNRIAAASRQKNRY